MTATLDRLFTRLSVWWVITLVLLGLVLLLAPQQLPVSLYKLSLVSMAGLAGYWLDRGMFPYARPHVSVQACDGGVCEIVPLQSVEVDAEGMILGEPMSIVSGDALSATIFASAAMLRRALIVAAAMVSIALGA